MQTHHITNKPYRLEEFNLAHPATLRKDVEPISIVRERANRFLKRDIEVDVVTAFALDDDNHFVLWRFDRKGFEKLWDFGETI